MLRCAAVAGAPGRPGAGSRRIFQDLATVVAREFSLPEDPEFPT